MENDKIEKYLKKIYYNSDHPASFGGIDSLYKFVKSKNKPISRAKIKRWLSSQAIFTKHREVRRKFKRTKVIVPYKFYQIEADTASMVRYAKYNNNYKYFLVLIEVLTRFVYTFPLKTLTGVEMVRALKSRLKQRSVQNLRTDSGTEFKNKHVKDYLDKRKINYFRSLNESKCPFAERVIKTLKSKLIKYMNYKNTFKWVKVLPEITNSYNKTYHRVLKMTPQEALKTDSPTLWLGQYGGVKKIKKEQPLKPPKTRSPYTFKIGDQVLLSHIRTPFLRAYDETWTTEHFQITERVIKQGIALYKIKDSKNNPILGTFYASELQKVIIHDNPTQLYTIEKIIKRRIRGKSKEVLVKWLGFARNFNSWIPESEVKAVK